MASVLWNEPQPVWRILRPEDRRFLVASLTDVARRLGCWYTADIPESGWAYVMVSDIKDGLLRQRLRKEPT